MYSEDGWRNTIPSLPTTFAYHCMVAVNSTTVIVIGGAQNGPYSGNTFYYTVGEKSWSGGPALKYPRSYPGFKSNDLFQILKLHMVLFKLEMMQAINKLFYTEKNNNNNNPNKSNTIKLL